MTKLQLCLTMAMCIAIAGCGGGAGSDTLSGATPTVTSLSITSKSNSVPVGLTVQFSAVAEMSNGTTQNVTSSVTWTSSSNSTISVNSSGLATGVAQGSATITGKLNSVTGSSTITIGAPIVTAVAVTPQTPSIALGLSQQFHAIATLSDGTMQDLTSSATWTSSAPAVANAAQSGLISSKTVGSATISAAVQSFTNSSNLTVGPAVVSSVMVQPSTLSLAQGTQQQLTATGVFTDGSTQNLSASATWASTSPQVATVTPSGLVSAVSQGSDTIKVSIIGVNGSAGLTVTPARLVSISINPLSISLPLGLSTQLSATGVFSDGTTQNLTSSVNWNSSNLARLTINASGLAHSLTAGLVDISAALDGVTGSSTLTVTSAALTSIQVMSAANSIAAGLTEQLSATGAFSDGSIQPLTSGVTWSSSSTGIATISSTGSATAVAPGSTTVTATVGGISGNFTLTITPATLSSLIVTPVNATLGIGALGQFSATGVFSDSSTQDVTAQVHWRSSSATIGIISNTSGNVGIATALAAGQSTITATLGSVSGSATLTVSPATLQSITVGPVNLSLALGTTGQLTATGNYSDGSSSDITASVTWTSSSTVASVSLSGLVTAITTGSSQVTATLGSVSGSATISVPTSLVSISLSAGATSLALGTTLQLQATGHFNDGSTQDLSASVEWQSNSSGTALINQSGLLTSLAVGPVTITATYGSVSGTISITVTSAILDSISITPLNGVLSLLSPALQLHATGHYSDGSTQDITTQVQWSSSNSLIAIVSNLLDDAGLVTGVALGTVSVTATVGSITATTTIQSSL